VIRFIIQFYFTYFIFLPMRMPDDEIPLVQSQFQIDTESNPTYCGWQERDLKYDRHTRSHETGQVLDKANCPIQPLTTTMIGKPSA
jgi:hypothetical protein